MLPLQTTWSQCLQATYFITVEKHVLLALAILVCRYSSISSLVLFCIDFLYFCFFTVLFCFFFLQCPFGRYAGDFQYYLKGFTNTMLLLLLLLNKFVEQLLFEFREVRCFPSLLCPPSAS